MRHDATLEVRSQLDVGSTFICRFPTPRLEAIEPAEAGEEANAGGPGRRFRFRRLNERHPVPGAKAWPRPAPGGPRTVPPETGDRKLRHRRGPERSGCAGFPPLERRTSERVSPGARGMPDASPARALPHASVPGAAAGCR